MSIPDLYVWSGAVGSTQSGLSWDQAFLSLATLEAANEANQFLKPAQRIYIAEDHAESNFNGPGNDGYWPMFLRNGTPMPCQIISVDRATIAPKAMLNNLQFDHVLALRCDAIWCGVNFRVFGTQPTQAAKTLRIGQGRYIDCNFDSQKHMLLGSYYVDDETVEMKNCLLETHSDEIYTFLVSSNQDRVGTTFHIEDCDLRHHNTRSDAAWMHLDASYSHVRLLDCTFSGLGTQNKILMRGNHSVFETNYLPPNFVVEDLTGTNHFILRS